MDLKLTGKRALVTASSGGIGEDIANRLAAEGCSVLVHGRDERRAQTVADTIRDDGGTADVVLGDLSVPSATDAVAGRAAEHGVDILVNNAGPFSEHDWDTAENDLWRRAFEGNVVSMVALIRVLTLPMRARGWGRVINVASRAVTTPLPNMVEYSAAKAAVVNMTTSLAQHLARTGITANCVSPGVIASASAGLKRMFEEREAAHGHLAGRASLEAEMADYAPNPSARLGTGEDISAAVAFLASPLAGYINGINLRVDGGIAGVP